MAPPTQGVVDLTRPAPPERPAPVGSVSSSPRWFLLCRHGDHRDHVLAIAGTGEDRHYPITRVAGRLADALKDERLQRVAIVHAASREAHDTAELLEHELRRLGLLVRDCTLSPSLGEGRVGAATDGAAGTADPPAGTATPAVPRASRASPALRALESAFTTGKEPVQVVIAVGHQPQVSQLTDELLNPRRWPGNGLLHGGRFAPRRPPTPIDRSGLVAIEQDGDRRPRLRWAVSYDDSTVLREIVDKIQRKMDVAKLLSGAVAFGLTTAFGVLLDKDKWRALGNRQWSVQGASALLLLAAALYFATMMAYDRLLMPNRFWGESRDRGGGRRRRGGGIVRRPPSSTAWVLYQNMMRIWSRLFTAASVSLALGLALLGYASLRLSWPMAIALAAGLVVVGGACAWWSRPVLGSED